MKYMQREVMHCHRGKAPEIVEDLKAVNQVFVDMGNTTGKIYVDISGRYDTVIWEVEVDSLDQFYTFERGFYVEPDAQATQLINHLNDNTVMGSREWYEVIV